ncbi:MAG: DNA mismatch repair protein MutS [Bacteroidales bacterium]|jgi:DNA mismatch repair protein MutS|nr:DNA mismatch repair protein MutS [Bacteroidales bacterium]
MSKVAATPLMLQYNRFKIKHPEAILLFRVGDFYETFNEDAVTTSRVLGITLTKRANGTAAYVDLAGFPYHSLDTYLPKLVKAGYRVAICEQLEDPKTVKSGQIVKRGVTELITPGVSINDKVLEQKENNFLGAIHFDKKQYGIAFLDISTGEFYVAEGNRDCIDKLIQNFKPMEMVIQKNQIPAYKELFNDKMLFSAFEDWVFTTDFSYGLLTKHFQTASLKGFGVENLTLGIVAAGAAMHYLYETQHHKIQHINKINRIEEEHYLWLDRFTIRNLELIDSPNEQAVTLIDVLDHTCTPMGARLLKKWLVLPLKEKIMIEERLSIVDYLIQHEDIADEIMGLCKSIGDLERLSAKIATGKISPREVVQLSKSLRAVQHLKKIMADSRHPAIEKMAEQINPCVSICRRVEKEMYEDAPALAAKGGMFKAGVDEELDELQKISTDSKSILYEIQRRETIRTGITSLKIGYNNVFGYYLEVTNTHKHRVPSEWIRKQTLTTAERYITEELKGLEDKILGASDRILEIEQRLFNELVISLIDYLPTLQLDARVIARADVLLGFANVSIANNYVKPVINEGYAIQIKNGRHPVIEKRLPPGEAYISNDIYLENDKQQIIIITGPNMSGKSALLRQTALIVLMAQMGCFVPAEYANIGIIDKVFTRVGASDSLSTGESTFMVEMNETASILNNISNRSLILLDEIGRGTSTYDGVSIAWSIAEFLHEHRQFRAKVLFATHYHELNDMASRFSRIRNFHVTVKELDKKILFLRKLEPGGSEHSFGIHVARMAGMPQAVLRRADEILKQLEQKKTSENANTSIPTVESKESGYQLSFIALDDPLLLEIKDMIVDLDIDALTPVEALMKLNNIKGMLVEKKKNGK